MAEIVPYPKVPYYPTIEELLSVQPMTVNPAFAKHIREQWMSSQKEKEKKNG